MRQARIVLENVESFYFVSNELEPSLPNLTHDQQKTLEKIFFESAAFFKTEIIAYMIYERGYANLIKVPVPKKVSLADMIRQVSKYFGEVVTKIYKNWKDPVGGGDGKVEVSFSVFPRGNIAMPKIVKSSGDPRLDNLAIRAVKNAVPLPPFPKEIKEPNIPLILGFDYVPKN